MERSWNNLSEVWPDRFARIGRLARLRIRSFTLFRRDAMKCPVCKTTDLLMTERRSIEIDYCPDCRGVWLDRGELDKLIAEDGERAGAPLVSGPNREDRRDRHREYPNESHHRYDERRSGHSGHSGHTGYRKTRSLFDMFDFD
jgi:Zn-finger nucleic acid-binding protein